MRVCLLNLTPMIALLNPLHEENNKIIPLWLNRSNGLCSAADCGWSCGSVLIICQSRMISHTASLNFNLVNYVSLTALTKQQTEWPEVCKMQFAA